VRYSRFLGVVGILVLAAPGRADDGDGKAPKELEGLWLVVGIESDGRAAAGDDVKDMRWSIQGSEIRVRDPDGTMSKMTFTLNSGKAPKEIDVTAQDGPQKGKTVLGIYELKDGRLRICLRDWEAARKGRPTEFGAQKGSGLGLITLERQPVKEKK
jgi:uncharacterized protein (TIGR03067 family)